MPQSISFQELEEMLGKEGAYRVKRCEADSWDMLKTSSDMAYDKTKRKDDANRETQQIRK